MLVTTGNGLLKKNCVLGFCSASSLLTNPTTSVANIAKPILYLNAFHFKFSLCLGVETGLCIAVNNFSKLASQLPTLLLIFKRSHMSPMVFNV